ncbi:hypothetical protein V8C86DRAFT_2753888 [Haematococcus lacustris]
MRQVLSLAQREQEELAAIAPNSQLASAVAARRPWSAPQSAVARLLTARRNSEASSPRPDGERPRSPRHALPTRAAAGTIWEEEGVEGSREAVGGRVGWPPARPGSAPVWRGSSQPSLISSTGQGSSVGAEGSQQVSVHHVQPGLASTTMPGPARQPQAEAAAAGLPFAHTQGRQLAAARAVRGGVGGKDGSQLPWGAAAALGGEPGGTLGGPGRPRQPASAPFQPVLHTQLRRTYSPSHPLALPLGGGSSKGGRGAGTAGQGPQLPVSHSSKETSNDCGNATQQAPSTFPAAAQQEQALGGQTLAPAQRQRAIARQRPYGRVQEEVAGRLVQPTVSFLRQCSHPPLTPPPLTASSPPASGTAPSQPHPRSASRGRGSHAGAPRQGGAGCVVVSPVVVSLRHKYSHTGEVVAMRDPSPFVMAQDMPSRLVAAVGALHA